MIISRRFQSSTRWRKARLLLALALVVFLCGPVLVGGQVAAVTTASPIEPGGAVGLAAPSYSGVPKGPPVLPGAFWGTATVGGSSLSAGTSITVWISDTQVAQTTSLINGSASVYSLDIPGDDPDTPEREGGNTGEVVRFKIGPVWANESGTWESGSVVNLNLTADSLASASTRWIAAYGYSAGGWTSQDKYPRMVGDVNGDGKADIVGFGSAGAYVSLSTGSAFGTSTRWIATFGYSAGGWTSQDKYPRMLADVNGDGRDDIVGFASAGVYVSLSTGNGFASPTRWLNSYGVSAGGWTSQDRYPRMLADMNGDGKDDVVGFSSARPLVALSTGSGFSTPLPWTNGFGASSSAWASQGRNPRCAADVNGDGRADIVGFGNDGTHVSLTNSGLTVGSRPQVVATAAFEESSSTEEIIPDMSQDKANEVAEVGPGSESDYAPWRGEYFANNTLTGEPTVVRDDQDIDFDWGEGAPDVSLPADSFSVRWMCALHFDEGDYIFHALADDGVRLFVDGQPLIDRWAKQEADESTGQAHLTEGKHALTLEYFEAYGGALAKLWWEEVRAADILSSSGPLR